MTTLKMYQVDVFTDRPLAGNPLAVFPHADGLSAAQMQAIAREMNLSETTFVTPPEGGGDARMRIFTPGTELPFAGHPSVGTACTLVRLGQVAMREPVTRVVLELGVGPTDGRCVGVAAACRRAPPSTRGRRVFGEEIPRGEAAAVLGLQEERPARPSGAVRRRHGACLRHHPSARPAHAGSCLVHARPAVRVREPVRRAVPLCLDRRGGALRGGALLCPGRRHRRRPGDRQRGRSAGAPTSPVRACLAPGESRVLAQGDYMGRPSRLRLSVSAAEGRLVDVVVGGGVVPVLEGELTL